MRILVVDDDAGCREVLREAFQMRGHSVVETETYAGAMSVLSQKVGPDAVVTDGQLDVSSGGADLMAHCQKIGLPAILLSGNDDIVEIARSVGWPALLKPPRSADAILALLAQEVRKR